MALTNLPTAALDFTFRDESGSIGHTLVHIPYGTLAAVAIAAADAIVASMALLSNAVCLGYKLTYGKTETTPAAPAAGSRVEDKGQFIWRTADGRTASFSIPAVVEGILNVDGSIDRTNADVIALIAVVTGVGSIFAGASGSDITDILSAYQRFSRSTRNQLPSAR